MKLAESNIVLADTFTRGTTTQVAIAKPEEKKETTVQKKKRLKKEEAEATEPEPKEVTKTEVSADDLRKVAGKLVEDGKKADFQAVLKQFETKNITLFEKDGGDLAEMLEALENQAGCKLAEIAD